MVDIISRSAWGALTTTSSANYADMALGIVTHWEGPTMGFYSAEQAYQKVRDIERYHVKSKGWRDIAYNFLIDYHGQIFEGRGWNKQNAANGGYGNTNYDYMSVCYLGGINDPLTQAARDSYLALHEEYVSRGGANRAYTHNDVLNWYGDATQCSGPELIQFTHAVLDSATFQKQAPVQQPTKDDMPDLILGWNTNYFGIYSTGKVRAMVWTEVVYFKDIIKQPYRDVPEGEAKYLATLANRPF